MLPSFHPTVYSFLLHVCFAAQSLPQKSLDGTLSFKVSAGQANRSEQGKRVAHIYSEEAMLLCQGSCILTRYGWTV